MVYIWNNKNFYFANIIEQKKTEKNRYSFLNKLAIIRKNRLKNELSYHIYIYINGI